MKKRRKFFFFFFCSCCCCCCTGQERRYYTAGHISGWPLSSDSFGVTLSVFGSSMLNTHTHTHYYKHQTLPLIHFLSLRFFFLSFLLASLLPALMVEQDFVIRYTCRAVWHHASGTRAGLSHTQQRQGGISRRKLPNAVGGD